MADHQMAHAVEITDAAILGKTVQGTQDTSCMPISSIANKSPHPAMYPALLAAGGGPGTIRNTNV